MKSIKMKVTIAIRDTSVSVLTDSAEGITFRRLAALVRGKEIAIYYYPTGCGFKKRAIKSFKKQIRKNLAKGDDDNG